MPLTISVDRVYLGGGQTLSDGLITVDDHGRIAAVSPRRSATRPPDHNFPGGTAVPGLIDMHTHYLTHCDSDPSDLARATTMQAVRAVEGLRATLQRGVTSVRDAGAWHAGIFAIRDLIDQGRIAGPSIFASGQAVAMTGGHGWHSLACEADGPDAVRRATRMQLKSGADCVKLMLSGGAGTAGEGIYDEQLTDDELQTAVGEAHRKGKPVLAHATSARVVTRAVQAGVDSIEHGLDLDQDTVALMAERGTYYCPTLQSYAILVEQAERFPAYMVDKARSIIGQHHQSFQLALAAGVKILAGTDAEMGYRLGDMPNELVRMVTLGMSPSAAVDAATATAASFLGAADTLGALKPGAWADILIVAGNPLEQIACLSEVTAVFKRGRKVEC